MIFHIVTIFPEIFDSYFNEGVVARAMKKKGLIEIRIYDLREYTSDKHRTVDDTPYGGGPGMVLKIQPIYKCVQTIKKKIKEPQNARIILFSANGKKYDQKKAQEYSKLDHLIMICGRYEGVDERVAKHIIDEEISIGDYILTGGEIPAMAVVDSTSRLIENVLGNPKSLEKETFNGQKKENIDYPVYTKPEEFQGWKVPKVLLSGNHGEIENWRTEKSKRKQ
jgi:tRNA (guanine37-N1)-methyltransferase